MKKHWNIRNGLYFYKTFLRAYNKSIDAISENKRISRQRVIYKMNTGNMENIKNYIELILSSYDDSMEAFPSPLYTNLPAWIKWEIRYTGLSEEDPAKVSYVKFKEKNDEARWGARRYKLSLAKLLKRWDVQSMYIDYILSYFASMSYEAFDIEVKILDTYEDIAYAYGHCGDDLYSCMRYNPNECLKFYEMNNVKLYTRWINDRLITKALLWLLDNGKYYMDKVYNNTAYYFEMPRYINGLGEIVHYCEYSKEHPLNGKRVVAMLGSDDDVIIPYLDSVGKMKVVERYEDKILLEISYVEPDYKGVIYTPKKQDGYASIEIW